MFWGLVMEPYKRYSQTVQHTFHLSMACLDVTKADQGIIQVMLFYEGKNYLLCNLNKESKWQVPLDITLEENSEIAFACNGNGHVHLTGYLIPSPDDDYEDVVSDSYQKKKQDKSSISNDHNPKRKATESPKSPKQAKRVKQETDESSDDDDDLEMYGFSEDDTEDSEDEGDLLEEEQDKDDSEEDEEDDEDDDEEEVQEYEQKKAIKPQQLEKKGKQSQEQQQQKKKQDKQKTINGKEIRQEQQKQQKKKTEQQQQQQNAQNEVKRGVVEGGVQVEELKVGQGAPAKSGKFVSVYYTGRLKNGKKFDATTQGDGFKFRLGKGEVIKGWDVGIAGMKVGGKRRITIPPNMAYGAKGSPPTIPANSTLVFDVELKKAH